MVGQWTVLESIFFGQKISRSCNIAGALYLLYSIQVQRIISVKQFGGERGISVPVQPNFLILMSPLPEELHNFTRFID